MKQNEKRKPRKSCLLTYACCISTSYINFTWMSSKQRHLPYYTVLQTNPNITFHINSVLHCLNSTSLPSQLPQQHYLQRHHSVSLIYHQSVHHLCRRWHRLATKHRRECNRALCLMVQWWQVYWRSNLLVSIRNISLQLIIKYGDSPVGVSRKDCELHRSGNEGLRGGVEFINCNTDNSETRLVGTVDEPHNKGRGSC